MKYGNHIYDSILSEISAITKNGLAKQWTFAPETIFIIYIIEAGTGITKDNCIQRFILFFIRIQTLVMPYPIANLIVVVQGIVIFSANMIFFSIVRFYGNLVFQVVFPVILILVLSALIYYFFIYNRTVPRFSFVSANNLKKGNKDEHASDTKAYIKRFGILHFGACFSINIKSQNSKKCQSQGKISRPSVAIL